MDAQDKVFCNVGEVKEVRVGHPGFYRGKEHLVQRSLRKGGSH